MNTSARIETRPGVCHGKPVIRGTRVMVAGNLGALAGGDSIEDVIEDCPTISHEDVLAALDCRTLPADRIATA